MKKLLLFILILFVSTINSQVRFDTLTTKNVGVGIIYTEIHEATNPWTIDVLEIDLSNEYNKIESVKSQNKLLGYQTVSQMATQKDSEGHTVVGAINGDFYASGGIPIGKQIVNGQILKQNSFYSSFGISTNNKPSLGMSEFDGLLITNNSSIGINDVNNTRFENNLTLYNSFYGNGTETNQFGTEVSINPITEWIVNDTVVCIVEAVKVNSGNMNLIENKAVLSGHGSAAQFLNDNISIGDTVKLLLEFTSMLPKINQLIGGYPKIINNGSNYVVQGYNEEGGPPHTFERHPRTAIGFSQDSTKLYFVTVDGRGYSIGMTLNELADFMIGIGIYQGINLDGGGSTTMWVRNKIVNVPSDGTERAVGNGILVYSTAPKIDTVAYGSISPGNLRIFKGEQIRISFEATDKYFNPIDIEINDIVYQTSEGIGSIDSSGLFTASENSSKGFITASYNGISDTCNVYIKTIGEIILEPEQIITNTINLVEYKQTAKDEDGVIKKLDNDEFIWTISDTSIAAIDKNGILQGKSEGETQVIVQYEDIFDFAYVTVKNIEGKYVLHSLDDKNDFSLVGDNLDLINSKIDVIEDPRSEGSASLKIVYEYTGDPSKTYAVNLSTNIPIEGVPDSIEIDLMTNGRSRNQLVYLLKDDNGENYQVNVKKWATASNNLDIQPGAFINATTTEPGSMFNFPITLTGIMIKLDAERESGVVYRDSLVLDNLRISYPDITTKVLENKLLHNKFELYQNYPNPFNPVTRIQYSIPVAVLSPIEVKHVSLKVYDILGREVATLVNEFKKPGNYEIIFDASDLVSGVYFYQLTAGTFTDTKKLILMK